ncbi:MAG: hypothetical protein IJ131_00775 [Eggerthellaceae bacterium]|nr:hypothetical protein [Eggerthellaceae bacterium]
MNVLASKRKGSLKALSAVLFAVLALGVAGLLPATSQQAWADTTLADGTYEATNIATDVTTDASGMIMVTKATVVVKDGKATAVVTMKGTGADRFYVSDTATKDTIVAEAIAEEQKEVGGEFGNLLGGLQMEGSSAYTFWPVPIELGQPKVYAARSASHFS